MYMDWYSSSSALTGSVSKGDSTVDVTVSGK